MRMRVVQVRVGVGVCGYRINLHSSVPTLVANFNMLVKSED